MVMSNAIAASRPAEEPSGSGSKGKFICHNGGFPDDWFFSRKGYCVEKSEPVGVIGQISQRI
ncbi:hypothetical protein ES703_46952 [subsurface metagenome]